MDPKSAIARKCAGDPKKPMKRNALKIPRPSRPFTQSPETNFAKAAFGLAIRAIRAYNGMVP